jgi:hypothetical protein
MSGDQGVPQQLARVDVTARAGAFGKVERHGQITNFDAPRTVVRQRDRPLEDIVFQREGLLSLEVRRRCGHRVAADAPLGEADGRICRHRRLDAKRHRTDGRELNGGKRVGLDAVRAFRRHGLPLPFALIENPP